MKFVIYLHFTILPLLIIREKGSDFHYKNDFDYKNWVCFHSNLWLKVLNLYQCAPEIPPCDRANPPWINKKRPKWAQFDLEWRRYVLKMYRLKVSGIMRKVTQHKDLLSTTRVLLFVPFLRIAERGKCRSGWAHTTTTIQTKGESPSFTSEVRLLLWGSALGSYL